MRDKSSYGPGKIPMIQIHLDFTSPVTTCTCCYMETVASDNGFSSILFKAFCPKRDNNHFASYNSVFRLTQCQAVKQKILNITERVLIRRLTESLKTPNFLRLAS